MSRPFASSNAGPTSCERSWIDSTAFCFNLLQRHPDRLAADLEREIVFAEGEGEVGHAENSPQSAPDHRGEGRHAGCDRSADGRGAGIVDPLVLHRLLGDPVTREGPRQEQRERPTGWGRAASCRVIISPTAIAARYFRSGRFSEAARIAGPSVHFRPEIAASFIALSNAAGSRAMTKASDKLS